MGVIAETGPLEGNGWTVVSGMTSDNAIETLSFTSAAARCVIDRVHLKGARTSSPCKASCDLTLLVICVLFAAFLTRSLNHHSNPISSAVATSSVSTPPTSGISSLHCVCFA